MNGKCGMIEGLMNTWDVAMDRAGNDGKEEERVTSMAMIGPDPADFEGQVVTIKHTTNGSGGRVTIVDIGTGGEDIECEGHVSVGDVMRDCAMIMQGDYLIEQVQVRELDAVRFADDETITLICGGREYVMQIGSDDDEYRFVDNSGDVIRVAIKG